MEDNHVLHWVQGNTVNLAIPLQQETQTPQGKVVEDYYPDPNDVVSVSMRGTYIPTQLECYVDGNVVIARDNGNLRADTYGVEIVIAKHDGTNLRSMWNTQVVIHKTNDGVLDEWNDFVAPDSQTLDAAVFFFAKGDKGDPFTYEDFTPEQIEDLKRPAYEAAEDVARLERTIEQSESQREVAEQGRVNAESQRVQEEIARENAETLRAQKENARVQAEGVREQNEVTRQSQEQQRQQQEQARATDYAQVKQDAQTATSNATSAANLANQKAQLAEEKAALANQKATEAENVDAEIEGTFLTVTNRQGQSKTVNTKGEAGTTDYEQLVHKPDLTVYVTDAIYDAPNHLLKFKNSEGVVIATIDAAPFIKDAVVDNVVVENGYLVITFNTDAGKQPISIPLTDIFDPSNYYTKEQTDTILEDMPDFVVEHEDEQSLIDEVDRVLLLLYQALTDAGAVITPAQAAAALANAKAQLAEIAATQAQQQAAYAHTQGDYAKTQGDAAKEMCDNAKGDFDSLDERLDYIEDHAGTIDFVEDNTDTFPWND